jgi:CBS domain-containing protein
MNARLIAYIVSSSATVIEAVAAIQRSTARCVAVLNEKDMVVGVFSEGDVMRALLHGADVHAPIQRLIAGSFVFLKERDLRRAYELMRDRGITFVPVVNDTFQLVDIVTLRDVLAASSPASS